MTAELCIDFDQRELFRLDAIADQLPRHSARARAEFDDVGLDAIAENFGHRASDKRAGRKQAANLERIFQGPLPEQDRTLRRLREVG